MAPNKKGALHTVPREDGVSAQTAAGLGRVRHARRSPGRKSGNPAMKNAREESAGILEASSKTLLSAVDNLARCGKFLEGDAARGTPSLALLARIHNVQKLREAAGELSRVISRLSASLAGQRVVGEKVFTPVLINTLTKESAQIHVLSKHLSLSKGDSLALESDLNSIRSSLVSGAEAFEPIRQAIFHPNRRRTECDRISNPTREYLRNLAIDWNGVHRVKTALPAEFKLTAVLHRRREKDLLDERTRRSILYPDIKYWPV